VVYVGAVAVLFLFVVMMLDINFAELRQGFVRYAGIGAVVGIVLVAEIIFVVSSGALSPAASTLVGSPTPAGVTNTKALGNILYTDYFYLFQAAGVVLLIAMIGAIVLTHREREGVKRQRIASQLARDRRSVEIKKVPTGTGI
jgi:NADH-quinone oxidoreductase subunit J